MTWGRVDVMLSLRATMVRRRVSVTESLSGTSIRPPMAEENLPDMVLSPAPELFVLLHWRGGASAVT